jgi:hypothetical protein
LAQCFGSQLYIDLLTLRKTLERAVQEARGVVTLAETALIQRICRLEVGSRMVEATLKRTTPDVWEVIRGRSAIEEWCEIRDRLIGELLSGITKGSSGHRRLNGDQKTGLGRMDWEQALGGEIPEGELPRVRLPRLEDVDAGGGI